MEKKEEKVSVSISINEVFSILPHRYPFLLVDRILEIEPGKRAVGLKNVSINEPFFQGHFPGMPIMPGVLVIEAMAQVAGVMLLSSKEHRGKAPFFGGMDKVRFRRPVLPGDTLITEATLLRQRGDMGKVRVVGRVKGKVVAEGEYIFALKPRKEVENLGG